MDPRVGQTLPHGSEEILRVLRRNGRPMGTGEMIEATGRSRPWVRSGLEALRKAGLVEWKGRSSRDPRATWEVKE